MELRTNIDQDPTQRRNMSVHRVASLLRGDSSVGSDLLVTRYASRLAAVSVENQPLIAINISYHPDEPPHYVEPDAPTGTDDQPSPPEGFSSRIAA
jgi:hypothetical protein